jgi:hypothetical protein
VTNEQIDLQKVLNVLDRSTMLAIEAREKLARIRNSETD